jgi:hypothetical protein
MKENSKVKKIEEKPTLKRHAITCIFAPIANLEIPMAILIVFIKIAKCLFFYPF